jgi:hypothetical protein
MLLRYAVSPQGGTHGIEFLLVLVLVLVEGVIP